LSCITTPSFLVLLNGEPLEIFGASSGYRQGDPLSPYLFIIMDKGLGKLIKSHVSQNLIHVWQRGNGLPTLSHLQFVDDMTLVGRAQIQGVEAFQLTLDTYLAAFGQKINDQKSSIFFFNTPDPIQ